ncbi:hypothetical protein [Dactylosporangium sp. NPDC049140]|uniref:hypothetical protein n=1 Tax=Dactylosporangium sp. NPDC049140 TaxID=3155647 RepID=UPI0033EDDE83
MLVVAAVATVAVAAGTTPASAAPIADGLAGRAPVAGVGVATARTVDARSLSSAAEPAAPSAAAADATVPAQRRGTALLPSRPSTGSKPAVPATVTGARGPNSLASRPVQPLTAPGTVANFAGIDQATGCGGCQPPDVNAAVGGTQILEAVNLRLQTTNKTGTQLCSFSLASFLGTTDSLSDPRVQYDNVNNRYSLTLTVVPASTTAAPALWVGASTSSDACGSWFIYRITFSGGSFPAGTLLDYPILGQDSNALLFGTDNFTPTSHNATVFGIPKSAVYAGAGFSFSAFTTASLSAPVSNAGIPMISTPFSYFVASVPGTGYRLYRLTNSGGAGAALTLQATISSTFNAPTRRINQPGTPTTLDPLDGRIAWSPVNDGNFIWFAHGIDIGGFPGVRYGAISIAGNTATVALAYRSSSSDDFNPSIGVANNPGGGNFIYVNWAYTDTANNIATSDTVDSVAPGGGVPNLIGTGAVLINGSATSQTRFGDYSSVAIDPTVASGSCAVVAQQYFAAGGAWRTRIGRVGTC